MWSMDTFVTTPAFCSDCGSILPLLRENGDVVCYTCSRHFCSDAFGDGQIKYTIHFNSLDAYAKNAKEDNRKDEAKEDEGPVVDRKCPKCGNDKMSYATLQLRSADEGQTVFYTCTKCQFKKKMKIHEYVKRHLIYYYKHFCIQFEN